MLTCSFQRRSMMDMVNADVKDSDIDAVTQEIMQRHGFQLKASLNLDDFQTVMSQYSDAIGASFMDEGKHFIQQLIVSEHVLYESRPTYDKTSEFVEKGHVALWLIGILIVCYW